MKVLIPAIVAMVAIANMTGCATPYLTDRWRDAADVVDIGVGLGVGAKLRTGPIQTGLLAEKGIAGFRGGQFVVNSVDYDPVLGTNSFPRDTDFQIILIGGETFESCTGTAVERKKNFAAGNIFSGGPFFHLEDKGDRPYYYTGLDAVLGLGLSFRLGFNPGELLDFILGWTTIDIFKDDIGIDKKPNQSSEATPEKSH